MKQTSMTLPALATASILLLSQCKTEHPKTSITLKNTTGIVLNDKAISIERDQLPSIPENVTYPLILKANGDTIPSQLIDMNGDSIWDELFFVSNLQADGADTLSLQWVETQPTHLARTNARFGKRPAADVPVQPAASETLLANELPKSIGFQRYQTDGPSWENDKIGFRHYLDGRNAKDLFGKTASFMSPDSVGINAKGEVEDNYHVMANWGRDILAVGNSVGLGGYALMTGDRLMRLGVTVNDSINNVDKTTFRILDKGPVKSVLNYRFENWQPAGRTYQVNETTAIWPGIYAYQNTVQLSGLQGDETLVIGLVNINNQNPIEEIPVNDQWVVLLTHDIQTYNREWWLGMAIIIPRDLYEGYTEAPKTGQLSNTFLAKLKVENGKPVTYYAAAGWELSDERFRDPAYFRSYIENLVLQLSAKVDVTIN